ncbi:PQQ-binding-like beta-propeller repeat protein [Sphingomonas japonica]|uniref:Outer membrane protein assembly factor BamB n=1 Tax=Sphingomonas japonica TaxID=511662 RepID=A0ABX0U292_9SPHN|nr:PQQ-binding-like beta-propeller repeat protein [Sphingomonas japonica]NIJ22833.1 outer membrane protein assembly factor BamB [Sphingomonas japonica]
MMKTLKLSVAVVALTALSACGIFGGRKATPTVGDRKPILLSETDVSVDPTLAGQSILLPAPVANADWAQPGGNAAKSMGHLALEGLGQAWSVTIPGGNTRVRLAAPPVVADGKLFVADTEGAVHALSADTGATLWKVDTAKGDGNASARFGGGVSYDGGRVYATNGLGDVVALNAADGAEIWRAKPGAPLRGSPTVALGQVYVITQDNQLFALDAADGKQVWTQSGSIETQGVFGVAAPAVAQGTVVAGFSSGELNAYRYENGRTLWADSLSRTSISTSVSSLADIDAEPVIDQGRTYAVGQGGRMVALDIATGQRLWEQNISGISTPWVVGEWIFLVSDDARLMALSRGSGRVRWISQLRRFRDEDDKKGPISWTGPVLAGNQLLLVNSLGEIQSVSPTDGTIGSTVDTRQSFTLAPVVANGTLFLLADDGRLTAYR